MGGKQTLEVRALACEAASMNHPLSTLWYIFVLLVAPALLVAAIVALLTHLVAHRRRFTASAGAAAFVIVTIGLFAMGGLSAIIPE
jgi:hypothetical protein